MTWKRWERWKHGFAVRGHPRALSTGVGAVGGLILFTTALSGGVAATQIVRVHDALAQAARVAVQSEQQNGCWTQATTSAVYHTLQSAGVNAGSVALTADTANSTTYGNPVTAAFTTKVGVSVLGASLLQIPVSAAANATSFYTPATAGAANTACVTPATCPTTVVYTQQCTPAHQVCQDVTTQDCTPQTQNVCGPVTRTQCGYTTYDEYTCTPLQRCHQETTQSCHPVTREQCSTVPKQCATVLQTVNLCG